MTPWTGRIMIGGILIIIAALILFFVPRLPMPPQPVATETTCINQMRQLSHLLIYYTDDNRGFLPPTGWDKENSRPMWVTVLDNCLPAKSRRKGGITQILKCPDDKSSSIMSYKINESLLGRNLQNIPIDKLDHMVLLAEKHFKGSHGLVAYCSGYVKRPHKRK